MSPSIEHMHQRLVRYGELVPCRTAFIDTHTPGSDQKENFTIIGGGVSESADQHVHIAIEHGYNIGAAGQPPHCRNSLHTHRTAEVFFVLKGRWRFFWGRSGTAGEVVLNEGDVFNIPTEVFRGFENIGSDYGMIMAVLGGDDAGGGVVWAPQVIAEAAQHGLVLSSEGKLYDSKEGVQLPFGVTPMPLLTEAELAAFPELTTAQVVPNHVARYWDLVALADKQPAVVVGEHGKLRDKPGFEIDFMTSSSAVRALEICDVDTVLMPMHGHWLVQWHDNATQPPTEYQLVLNPGDTLSVPPHIAHAVYPAVSGHASLFRVRATADSAGPTWKA
jgi:quercetin dioxygenase-like cupin family protein